MPTSSSNQHPSGFRPVAGPPGTKAIQLSTHTQDFDVLDPLTDEPPPKKAPARHKALKRVE